MFYKMFNHIVNISFDQYTQLSTVITTRYSHQLKLIPMSSKKNPSKFSFLSRSLTIPLWNRLPEKIINCNLLDTCILITQDSHIYIICRFSCRSCDLQSSSSSCSLRSPAKARSPVYSWVDWSNASKVLAQGNKNNSKQATL